MTASSNGNSKSLVVIQLSGGNDALNTIVPFEEGVYYDNRPSVRFEPEEVLPIHNGYGLNPNMAPIKELWDEGKVAIVNGIGYENPNRSHFRSMDIWHTAEPDKVGNEGWLGRVIRDLDPNGENVLTGINFGRGLPRSLACPGVQVASVGNLETYGLFPDIKDEWMRKYALEAFSLMYGSPGKDNVMEFLGQAGTGAFIGADILRTAPEKYSSSVEYAADPFSQKMKSIAQVLTADLGTRVFYTDQGSYDTHAGEMIVHSQLVGELSAGVQCFMDDLKEHGKENDAAILIFTEFGRRIKDNGSGTDHGAGGVAMLVGGSVNGGLYGEYPSLKEEDQIEGDLRSNNDFRSTYSTILEQWLDLEAAPIVNGHFEQFDMIRR